MAREDHLFWSLQQIIQILGGSSGLVVMGGDSRSEGRGFSNPVPYTGWTFFDINLL